MKHTKHKLLSSIATLFVCLAMFIGSTYAWFTDSASTGVNKIQAGNLDVALEMKEGENWVNAEGKTLEFKKAAGAPEGEKVLWEPGCTYELPALHVVNKGNLNLKYKIEITGIQGDAKLNEAIEWTINEAPINLAEVELAAGDVGSDLVIKGHMKEEAGNEYKNLSIDGISITVYATQATGESDSFGPNYDAGAQYVKKTATIMSETDGKTYTLESGKTYTVGNATVTVADNGDISYANSGTAQTVSITTNGGTLTVDAPLDTVNHYGEADFVDVNAIAGDSFHEFGKVGILSIAQGRVVAENGNNIDVIQVKDSQAIIAVPENKTLETKLEKVSSVTTITLKVINSSGQVVSSQTTTDGQVNTPIPEELKEVLVTSGSTPTISDSKDYVARIENNYYETLDQSYNNANANDEIVLLVDINLNKVFEIGKSITIKGNGHSIYNTANRVIRITEPNLDVKLYDLGIISNCTATSDVRGISFDDVSSGSSLELDGCTVSASFYAINISPGSQQLNINIKNGTVAAGWAAINCYANNSTFTIENSVLKGLNDKGESSWNDFATIVFDGNGLFNENNVGSYGSDNVMNISDSTIYASSDSENNQAWLAIQYGAWNNDITLSNTIIKDDFNNDQLDNIVFDPIVGWNGSTYSKTYDVHSKLTIDGVDDTYCYHGEEGITHQPFYGCPQETE